MDITGHYWPLYLHPAQGHEGGEILLRDAHQAANPVLHQVAAVDGAADALLGDAELIRRLWNAE